MKATRKILAIVLALMLALSSMAVFAEEPVEPVTTTVTADSVDELAGVPAPAAVGATDDPNVDPSASPSTPTSTTKPDDDTPSATCPQDHSVYAALKFVSEENTGLCTEAHTKTYECPKCGAKIVETIRPAVQSHTLSSTTTAATCGADGFTETKCTNVLAGETDANGKPVTCAYYEKVVSETDKATGRHDMEWKPAKDNKDATCAEAGHLHGENVCKICGKKEAVDETIPKLTHKWFVGEDEITYSSEADLLAKAQAANLYFNVTVKAVDNVYTVIPVSAKQTTFGETYEGYGYGEVSATGKAATCTTAGSITLTCKKCGDSYPAVLPATGHDFKPVEDLFTNLGDFKGSVKPTCTKAGYNVLVCQNYKNAHPEITNPADFPESETQKEEVLPLGHDFSTGCTITYETADGKAIDAADVANGKLCADWVEIQHCKREDVTTGLPCTGTKKIPHAADKNEGHIYELINPIEQPTCGKDGTGWYRCKYCNAMKQDVITTQWKDHAWQDQLNPKPATCTAEGSKNQKCLNCGATRTVTLPKISHTVVKVAEKSYDANCVTNTPGHIQEKCKICGTITKDEDIPVIEAHKVDASKKYEKKAPDCENAGYEKFTCSLCKKEVTKPIKALGHLYTEGVNIILQKQTCEKDQIEAMKCQRTGCPKYGEPFTTLKATGHKKPATVTVLEAATCTKPGKIAYNCINPNCDGYNAQTGKGKYVEETVPAQHSYKLVLTDGKGAYMQCTVCGATQELTNVKSEVKLSFPDAVATSSGTSGRGTVSLTNADVPGSASDLANKMANVLARISWSFKLANGETMAFCTCNEVKWDSVSNIGTFRMQGPQVPLGAKLTYVSVIITDDDAAESKTVGDVHSYASGNIPVK